MRHFRKKSLGGSQRINHPNLNKVNRIQHLTKNMNKNQVRTAPWSLCSSASTNTLQKQQPAVADSLIAIPLA
jgi:hypothetical protein